jgi:hypothetical protein
VREQCTFLASAVIAADGRVRPGRKQWLNLLASWVCWLAGAGHSGVRALGVRINVVVADSNHDSVPYCGPRGVHLLTHAL